MAKNTTGHTTTAKQDTTARKTTARKPTARTAKSQRSKPQETAGPGLFDITDCAERTVDGAVERVPLDEITLAVNPRKDMDPAGLARLAGLLMKHGQFVPAIGRRDGDRVLLYAGQRRLRAAQLSGELAGTDGFEGLRPVTGLLVLLLDYEPTERDIRRIQAAENNARESLGMADQQTQFEDCWKDRAGAPGDERMALVCDDLGITAKKGHNLRRCMTLPEPIRARVAERPTGAELSIGMANQLAEMHEISPALVLSVADRVSSPELHSQALRDIGGFVHKTVVEDPAVYAVRIDDGALLDAHDEIERARTHLTDKDTTTLEALFAAADPDREPDQKHTLDQDLDTIAKRAKTAALKLRVDQAMRERAANGRFAWVHHRGTDFADGVWVIDPRFLIECAITAIDSSPAAAAREEAFFKGARVDDTEMHAARADDDARRKAARERQQEAIRWNLGLGEDIRAGLIEASPEQLSALRDIVVLLVATGQPDVLAFGAGWTDRANQQPVGDTTRYEPRAMQAIVDTELERALNDPDPLRGIALLLSRWAAAFMLDPDGVTKSKGFGIDRMGRRLREALPGDADQLRSVVWAFMRPMLSPGLIETHRDAFVRDDRDDSTADLDAHRADSNLHDLDLGDNTP